MEGLHCFMTRNSSAGVCNDQPLDHVFQFPNVSRPIVVFEYFQAFVIVFDRSPVVLGRVFFAEKVNERTYVLPALPKRRQFQREHL